MSARASTRAGQGLRRAGGGVLLLVLWAGVAWLAWWLASPGPTPELKLFSPASLRTLPLGVAVKIEGTLQRASSVRCGIGSGPPGRSGGAVRAGEDGSFFLRVPGPRRPGMALLRCEVTSSKGRRFPFPFARLAGATRHITDEIPDAVVLLLPLARLKAEGGLLHGLSRLVSGPLARYIRSAAARMSFSYGGIGLGPVRVKAVDLLSVEAAEHDRLAVTLALRGVSVGLQLPRRWAHSKGPTWVRLLASVMAGQSYLKLRTSLPLRFLVQWPRGRPPSISLGPISTDHLSRALGLSLLTKVLSPVLALFSRKLHTKLNEALAGARSLLRHVRRIQGRIGRRLSAMVSLLPPLPASISPRRIAPCLTLRLSHLTTSASRKLLRFHMAARVIGFAADGHRCSDPSALHPLLDSALTAPRRLLLGPPSLDLVPPGPALIVSHDIINAYLATVWASGGLSRVPVKLPGLRSNGFDIHHVSYRLPPVLTTTRADPPRLLLEVPELLVHLRTQGEPGRLFAAHLRAGLEVRTHIAGRLRFVVPRGKPPKIWVRCLREAGGPCAAQSRRFQSLVDVGLELAFSSRLAGPVLSMEAALPPLRGPGVRITLGRLRPISRGVMVPLKIR